MGQTAAKCSGSHHRDVVPRDPEIIAEEQSKEISQAESHSVKYKSTQIEIDD